MELELAKAIADYGFMAVFCAVTLIGLSFIVKSSTNQQKRMFDQLLDKQSGTYLYETPMEQIRVIQSAFFDLSKYQVLEQLERIHDENNLSDKESVRFKIEDVLTNIHHDRKSKLDTFKYHGTQLSKFTNDKWIPDILEVCLKAIYVDNSEEFNSRRAYIALDIAYNKIKIEFYNNILTKS